MPKDLPSKGGRSPFKIAEEMLFNQEQISAAQEAVQQGRPFGLTVEAIKEAIKLLEDQKVKPPYKIVL